MTDTFVTVIFWFGILWAAYAYLVFPMLASLLGSMRKITAQDSLQQPWVLVTLIIPAYNEEKSIGAKIRNARDADYPKSLLELLVVSDASTDGTNEIARQFAAEGVRLIAQETRRGKTAGLNRAMEIAQGDIVVFTDANASFPCDTIGRLVRYFQDPTVGLVSGYTRYTQLEGGQMAEATNAYTSFERQIKKAESKWGCCVGADGAIFAMRRSLYRPLRDDDINDFVLPLSVIDQGYRCLLAEDAFCSETPGKSLESEFRRQSRITNRSLRAIWRHMHLLNALRFPGFSFFLFSHKVVRFLTPVFLLLSAASLLLLAPRGNLYLGFVVFTALVALLVAAAQAWPRMMFSELPWSRPVRLVNVFVLMNLAMLHGWWKFLTGNAEATWQHDRALSR